MWISKIIQENIVVTIFIYNFLSIDLHQSANTYGVQLGIFIAQRNISFGFGRKYTAL